MGGFILYAFISYYIDREICNELELEFKNNRKDTTKPPGVNTWRRLEDV